jgi:hypothetical protein
MRLWILLIALAAVLAQSGGARSGADSGTLKFKIFGDIPLVTVRGVPAAGNPWVTDNSQVRLAPNGDLDIKIRGLVVAAGLNAAGAPVPAVFVGTNPVPTVRIAVTWAVPAPMVTAIQETGPLPLDPEGNLRARVNIGPPPAGGERPVVLVRAGGVPLSGPFIGLSDFVRDFGSSDHEDDDD